MAYLRSVCLILAFVAILHCAPVDENPIKPPGIQFSTSSTTGATPSASTTVQHLLRAESKRHAIDDDSSDSKDSSEEDPKRPARDTETSGVVVHQTKQASTIPGVVQTPPPVVAKEDPKHQLPARETRGVYDGEVPPPRVHSINSQSSTTKPTSSAGISSTTSHSHI